MKICASVCYVPEVFFLFESCHRFPEVYKLYRHGEVPHPDVTAGKHA